VFHEHILSLRSVEDVVEARALVRWIGRPHFSAVHVDAPSLDEDTRQRSAKRVRKLFNDCGCGSGQVAFLAAFPIALWRLLAEMDAALLAVAGGLVIATAVSIAGKGLGLAWSRWRLLTKLRELEVLLIR
jgi:hypothetical protein